MCRPRSFAFASHYIRLMGSAIVIISGVAENYENLYFAKYATKTFFYNTVNSPLNKSLHFSFQVALV
jgi:hypothetical protein